MKKIHLVPLGGLGNRIRTISSVYNYCRSLGIPLTVHWHCSHRWGMAVPFRTIFEPFPHGIGLVDNKWGDFFNYNLPARENLYIPRLVDLLGRRKALYNLGDYKLAEMSVDGGTTIVTGSQQCELYPIKELFRPVREIREKIATFREKNWGGGNVVGCHIRRTDNVVAVKNSTTDKFEERIDRLFDADAGAKVFLCTDDIEVKSHLSAKYGDKIITYESTLNRDSLQGVRDAIAEMWLLSMAKEIYGSYWSSFSDMASAMGGAKLTVVK